MTEKQRYLPLDGLRGVAIAVVFWFHYRLEPHSPGEWGWIGVDIFFALSGFLITGILFDSLGEPRYFRNFYMRRALRIFPLYWGLWCILLALTLAQSRFQPVFLAWPLYVGNYLSAHALRTGLGPEYFDVLPAGLHIAHNHFYLRLGPFWSLCVEEQYYLTWPLIVWLVRQRRRLLFLCALGIAGSLALRTALYFSLPAEWRLDNVLYFWTFTRADSLLAGSALALWVRGPEGIARLRTLPVAAVTGASIAALALADWRWGLFLGHSFAGWMQTWGLTVVGLVGCGLVALSLRSTRVAKVLAFRPLQHLGRVSYGFYVFHLLFIDCDRILIDATRPHVPATLIHAAVFAWVWLLSWASFRWYESPFLRLKQRWGGRGEERKARAAASAMRSAQARIASNRDPSL